MKKSLFILLILVCSSTCWCNNKSNDSLSVSVRRYSEYGIKYNQINKGFFEGTIAFYKEAPKLGYVVYADHEFDLGYSPWKNSFIAETNHRFVFIVLCVGLGGGYCTSINSGEGTLFAKPEIGLNLFYFQVYYAYSLVSKDNSSIYNKGSNIILSIPIYSTYYYQRFREKKHFHWGGIYPGMDKPEDYDPQFRKGS